MVEEEKVEEEEVEVEEEEEEEEKRGGGGGGGGGGGDRQNILPIPSYSNTEPTSPTKYGCPLGHSVGEHSTFSTSQHSATATGDSHHKIAPQ